MARRKNPGQAIRDKREAGGLILDDVAYEVRHMAPAEGCSSELIRRYEAGKPLAEWRPTIIAKLVRILDLDPAELGPEAVEVIDKLALLVPAGWAARDSNPEPAGSLLAAA